MLVPRVRACSSLCSDSGQVSSQLRRSSRPETMHAHGGKASFSNGPKGANKGKGKSKGNAGGKGGSQGQGNPAWQAAYDAYQKILHGSSTAPVVPQSGVWSCKGPGGCSHDSNPPGSGVCLMRTPMEFLSQTGLLAGTGEQAATTKPRGRKRARPVRAGQTCNFGRQGWCPRYD